MDPSIRARNALVGLAVGDAISWPAMFHRSRLLPPWTRRLRRDIDKQRENTGVLRVPMPFSLNQPAETFDLCPTDDSEWAAWTMDCLMKHECSVETGWVTKAWLDLANEKSPVRGWVSTEAALANLRRGVMPPASGRDNPHYFDDGAACRAVVIGIACAGDPARASSSAEIDASVTNFADGILVARAVASAVSMACAGASAEDTLRGALAELPEGTWTQRVVAEGLRICRPHASIVDLLPALHGILNREYSDGSVGPETLAVTLAIVSQSGPGFNDAISAACLFAKGADSIPPLAGALAGALTPHPIAPGMWESCLGPLRGICVPALAGRNYLQIADEFLRACSSREVQT